MSNPNVHITIPGMPAIDMSVHPMNEEKPMFRLRGSLGRVSVSVSTPQIESAVSPLSCASGVANVIGDLYGVTREQMFLGRANEHTFLIIYGVPIDKAVLLNTHIVSSAGAAECVEVHVSKVSTSDDDIEPWFNGFGDADIRNY